MMKPYICPKCEGWKKVVQLQESTCTAIEWVECPVCGAAGVLWYDESVEAMWIPCFKHINTAEKK